MSGAGSWAMSPHSAWDVLVVGKAWACLNTGSLLSLTLAMLAQARGLLFLICMRPRKEKYQASDTIYCRTADGGPNMSQPSERSVHTDDISFGREWFLHFALPRVGIVCLFCLFGISTPAGHISMLQS